MLETTRFEVERRLPGSVAIALILSAFAGMVLLIAPGVVEDLDIDALLEQFPPALIETFGLDQMGTIEGFIALELYQFVWPLGIGGYLAYAAAGTIAGDIETERMDTLLAAPIARYQLLCEKYLALLTPIVIVNVLVFAVMYVGAGLVGEPLSLADLAAVHGFSIPYFLCCAALGMAASVLAPGRLLAEGAAVGVIVGTFLLGTLVSGTDLSWVANLTLMEYYDPLTILTRSIYDWVGAVVLLATTGVLLGASAWLFTVRDVT